VTEATVAVSAPPNDLSVGDLRIYPDMDGRISVNPERAAWRYLSFDVLPVHPGSSRLVIEPGHEVAIVVLAGRDIRVTDAGATLAVLEGRDDPFAGLPWAIWLPAASSIGLSAAGDGIVAIARAPRSGARDTAKDPIVLTPSDIRVEIRGAGNATRQINHIVPPSFPADRLLLVEVLTPSGNWSSWPPHKHDVDDMPTEAVLEEVYLYQFRRREAWGVQRLYRGQAPAVGGPRDGVWAVRHGELVVVTDGYHPFAASPADDAYYLNALAGDRRTMACSFDPDLEHVLASWEGMATDDRVPFAGHG
jgi:5-deoxy-glucuronate isomerase